MATFKDTLLVREVTKLSQELVSMKSPQKYAQKQIKGYYPSNSVTITSWIQQQQAGYELRVLEATLEFTSDKPTRQTIASLQTKMYNSSGSEIIPQFMHTASSAPAVYAYSPYCLANNPSKMRFYVVFAVTGSSTDAFYATFTALANDTGILKQV